MTQNTTEYEKAEQVSSLCPLFFDSSTRLELEIGSGKGTFLLEQARAHPETNFIGIEWANKYCRYAADRMARWGLRNVRVIRTDAAQFVAEHVPDSTISTVHLYFPDPWPKKKHHKRRFFNDVNLEHLLRILKPGGLINMATDHAGYFEQMRDTADRAIAAGRVSETAFVRGAGARDGETVGTNFERKYLKEGRPIYTLALTKQ